MPLDESTSQTRATATSKHPATWKTTTAIRGSNTGRDLTRSSRHPPSPAPPRSGVAVRAEAANQVHLTTRSTRKSRPKARAAARDGCTGQRDARLYHGRQGLALQPKEIPYTRRAPPPISPIGRDARFPSASSSHARHGSRRRFGRISGSAAASARLSLRNHRPSTSASLDPPLFGGESSEAEIYMTS